MNLLIDLDHKLFYLINYLPHNPFFDALALVLSGIGFYGIGWLFIGTYIFFKEEKKDKTFFVSLSSAAILSFISVNYLFKPLFGRFRPGDLAIISPLDPSGFYSFPSGHATFAFSLALVLSAKEPKLKWVFLIISALVSLSRIYLGKHYPFDVFAGAILGCLIAIISVNIEKLTDRIISGFKKIRYR